MMEKYATEAVRLAPTFGCALDYSEDSLRQLENILAQLSAEVQRSAIDSGANDSVQKRVDADSRIWGGYFGETILRLWGGEWGVETYPGTVSPVVSVDIGGAKLFPVMKVYRRLTQGEGESVWSFYQMVREKLSSIGDRH